mgnify:CR=1 FL=1
MTTLKLLLSAALIASATITSAGAVAVDFPVLTFPKEGDVISTQSCETDPETGVTICGAGS